MVPRLKKKQGEDVDKNIIPVSRERVLFAISSATSMGACSTFEGYLGYRWIMDPELLKPIDRAIQDIRLLSGPISKLRASCLVVLESMKTLLNHKSIHPYFTSFDDNVEIFSDYGDLDCEESMINKLSTLSKKNFLDGEGQINKLINKIMNNSIIFDICVIFIDLDMISKLFKSLEFGKFVMLTTCYFVVMKTSKVEDNTFADFETWMTSLNDSSKVFSCFYPSEMKQTASNIVKAIVPVEKKIKLKQKPTYPGIPLNVGLFSDASVELIQTTETTIRRWKNVEKVSIVGFLPSAFMSDLNGIGYENRFQIVSGIFDSERFTDKMREKKFHSDRLLQLLLMGLVNNQMAAFCAIQKTNGTKYGLIHAVDDSLSVTTSCYLDNCSLVMCTLSDEVSPETWVDILKMESGVYDPSNHYKDPTSENNMVTRPDWTTQDSIKKNISKCFERATICKNENVFKEELLRMQHHSKLLGMSDDWLHVLMDNMEFRNETDANIDPDTLENG